MSDSSGAANSSSWTVLTAEETVAETLRPVAEGTEHHEDTPSHTAAEKPTESRPGEDAVSAEESHSVKLQQETQETQPERDKDYNPVVESPTHDLPFDPAPDSTPALDSTSASVAPLSSLLEVLAPTGLDPNTHSQSRSLPGKPAPPISDPDSFSDSYTHISSSPDLEEPPALLLNTEQVGLVQEAEGYIQDVHHHYEEGLGQEEEESDLSKVRAKTDSHLEAEVVVEEEEVSGVRRRRGSLLAALERIGREEEEEDEFRIPQQREQEETGFSLNKCILGAVILLSLGTIIFSGVFMDLDDEGDYDARELRETEVVGKQEWLNPEVPLPPPVEVDSTDQLNKLAKEDPRIAVLQAQLLAQKEELKVAQKEAEDGGKERKKREEVEKEHGRLKKEMTSLPVLQKENERMKRELESVPVLQKDLETLRATVTELKHITAKEAASPPVSASVPPPSGQAGDDSQNTAGTIERKVKKPGKGEKTELKEEKTDWNKGGKTDWNKGGKTDWNKGGKTDWNKGGKKDYKVEKEWRSGKYDQEKEGKEEKEWKKKEDKKGEWKKDKSSRGDEGKPWKDRGNKMEWKEKREKKDWKVEKDWKKENPERWSDSKEWKGEKNGKEEKHLRKGGWNEGRDEWKGEKNGKEEKHLRKGGYIKGRDEWKKDKDDYKDLGKGWKERGERREWKGEKDWTKKDVSKEWKSKDNRRENEWSDGNRKMEGLKEERNGGNWKKDRGNDKYEKDHHHHHYSKEGQKEKEMRMREKGPPQTHRRPPLEQPDYWSHQRERLQHKPNPQTHCSSVEACAQSEGLLPVTMPEFEALLLGYLVKAERVGVEASKREELSKLTKEFFSDGVFVHDQMSFKDFVEDVDDILEDMVEDEEVEEEMDDFEEEAMNRFSVPGGGEREKWKKDSGRGVME
nr:pre-B-cell leukemia transcription factor-interacting protein 1-like isoform X3 [Oncorhynchus nerka]